MIDARRGKASTPIAELPAYRVRSRGTYPWCAHADRVSAVSIAGQDRIEQILNELNVHKDDDQS